MGKAIRVLRYLDSFRAFGRSLFLSPPETKVTVKVIRKRCRGGRYAQSKNNVLVARLDTCLLRQRDLYREVQRD